MNQADKICRCPYCNMEVPGSAPFCQTCEIELVDCPACGKLMRKGTSECPHCGHQSAK